MLKKVGFVFIIFSIVFMLLSLFIEKEMIALEADFTKTLFTRIEPLIERRDAEVLDSILSLIVAEKDYCRIIVKVEKWDSVSEKLCRVENSHLSQGGFTSLQYDLLPIQKITGRFALKNGEKVSITIHRLPFRFRTYFAVLVLILFLSIAVYYYFTIIKLNNELEEKVIDRTRMLDASQKNLDIILNSIDAGIVAVGEDGRIKGVNNAAAQLLEQTREASIGQEVSELLKVYNCTTDKKVDFSFSFLNSIHSTDFSFRFDRLLLKTNKNAELFISLAMTLVKNEEDAFNAWIFFFRDITEEVRLEKKFKQTQKLEAVGQLAGGIAHDFNNLLQIILGYSGLLEETYSNSSDEKKENIKQVIEAGERAQNLVKKILSFSRVKHDFKPVAKDMNKIIADSLKMISRLLEKSVKIVFNPNPEVALASCDPEQFEQILINLCVNARDAMHNSGVLTIALKNANLQLNGGEKSSEQSLRDYVCCEIQDTGEGIKPQYLDKIFDPFFTTKETGKGTGLGLVTVFNIVEQHEGHITVNSTLGVGTVFRVYIPAAENALPGAMKAAPVHRRLEGTGETILVAEDQPEVQRLAVKLLEASGYGVIAVNNGQEAVDMFNATPEIFDLLLFDLIMPELSGWDAAKQILDVRPDIPLVFCSGYSEEKLSDELDYVLIEKPYTKDKLLSVIKEKLRIDD
jgi:PAS domain S-box-containing protein